MDMVSHAGVPEAHKGSKADLWIILGVAAALRLWALDLKAPHFDEGINGWFADGMWAKGFFEYDPTNYHGPWHFYALFLSQALLGRSLWALRLPVVLASLLCIPVLFLFARWFGRAAVRWAALAFAVSPACIFYGRYSIHEPWFVLFSMLFVWGAIALWLDRDKAGLWAATAGLTGMVLNKETYVLHAGSLALAAGVFALWGRVVPLRPQVRRAQNRAWTPRDAMLAGAVAVFALVFFYSGNFFNFRGLAGPFEALVAWTKTGAEANGHEKTAYELLPFVNFYWIALLARYEWPALIGLVWSVRYAWPGPAAPRLLAIYAAGALLAYSVIPYKTPWCVVSILWPWFLFFGTAVSAAGHSRMMAPLVRVAAAALLASSLAVALRLNFREFENDREPYVYVQTYRSIDKLTAPLLGLAAADSRFYSTPVSIYCESYYPLPWILGDFTAVGYPREVPPEPSAQVHVIETKKADTLRAKLGAGFVEERFRLRSGMDECSVFFERALLDRWHALEAAKGSR